MHLPCIALTFPLGYAVGCFRLCNWSSWWCLEPSINNLPPVCPSISPRMFTTHCAWLLWMYKYLTILFAVIQKHFHIRPFYSDMWSSIQSHKLSSQLCTYRKTSNISRTLVGNKIVDHSDIVGASPSALLQLHLYSRLNIWLKGIRQRQPQDSTRIFKVLGFGASYIRVLTVLIEQYGIMAGSESLTGASYTCVGFVYYNFVMIQGREYNLCCNKSIVGEWES